MQSGWFKRSQGHLAHCRRRRGVGGRRGRGRRRAPRPARARSRRRLLLGVRRRLQLLLVELQQAVLGRAQLRGVGEETGQRGRDQGRRGRAFGT